APEGINPATCFPGWRDVANESRLVTPSLVRYDSPCYGSASLQSRRRIGLWKRPRQVGVHADPAWAARLASVDDADAFRGRAALATAPRRPADCLRTAPVAPLPRLSRRPCVSRARLAVLLRSVFPGGLSEDAAV